MSLIQARYGADVEWLTGNAGAFDTETTGVDTSVARVVTAHVLEVGPDGAVDRGGWLVNPGVEIPERVAAIHGITTAKAQAEGIAARAAVPAIVRELAAVWARGLPLIIMNAPYDLSLMLAELQRHGLPPFELGPVLDPLAIDRMCRPDWRGKRNLEALALHYGVKQEGAHNSRGDALTAARVVWKQARLYRELAGLTLAQMQERQATAHRLWAEDFGAYLRRTGKQDDVGRDWPLKKGAA